MSTDPEPVASLACRAVAFSSEDDSKDKSISLNTGDSEFSNSVAATPPSRSEAGDGDGLPVCCDLLGEVLLLVGDGEVFRRFIAFALFLATNDSYPNHDPRRPLVFTIVADDFRS